MLSIQVKVLSKFCKKNHSFEEPLKAPVITKQALYCTRSIFFYKEAFKWFAINDVRIT